MKNQKQLTVLRTGLAYDKIIKDLDRRELRLGSDEKNWNNYIEIAKGLLAVAEVSRMGVAEIAIRATLIRCGGDRHSLNWKVSKSKLTVKAFANSIGVKPNTLMLWISIKQRVFDALTTTERAKFKHDVGEKTYKMLGKKRQMEAGVIQQAYQSIANQTPQQKRADRAVKYAMALRKIFTQYLNYLSDDQVSGIKLCVLEILKKIEEQNEKKTRTVSYEELTEKNKVT